MDWGKGVAVVEAAAGGSMTVVHFDPKTLQLQ